MNTIRRVLMTLFGSTLDAPTWRLQFEETAIGPILRGRWSV